MHWDYLWWRDGIIYQIYPRSFYDTNGDGIGDLNGIRSKLDLLKELGISAIWLSPVYPSPDVDFGYDVADYTGIDPQYGSMENFDRLVEEAHARDIRVVMDLVLNHTSDQHPWFLKSRQSRDNPFADWYLWRDPLPGGGKPNNWASMVGGSGWEYVPERGQYYFHLFYKEQPDLNWRNPDVKEALLNVFRFWLDRGVDGFRLDIFNCYFKDAGFRNNPPQLGIRRFDRQKHIYDIDQPEMLPVLKEIREVLDAYPERYAVGETFLGNNLSGVRYCGSDLLHGVFDFDFLENRWSPAAFLKSIQKWENLGREDIWPTYVLGNHDVPRIASRFGRSDEKLKLLAALQLTMRGTPFIYSGEMIGMQDIPIKRSQILDPVGKHYWPFFIGRDGCRSPIQWDESPQAGFTSGNPWLPVHADYTSRNVKNQLKDENSLLNFYKRLIHLRREYPALQRGMFQALTLDPRSILAYLRQTEEQTILAAFNFSGRLLRLALGARTGKGVWRLLLSSKRESAVLKDPLWISLQGCEAAIYILEKD